MIFRNATPTRRTGRKVAKFYTSYRKTLKEDFDSRCGYCGSFDKIFKRSFAIDHFIPQNPDGFVHVLPANDYYNLVYACGYCNSAKSNKWPTNDPAVANDGKVGFVDPVDNSYDLLFKRESDGAISLANKKDTLSNYIHKELDLINIVHSVLWKLEKVDNSIRLIEDLVNNRGHEELKDQLFDLLTDHKNLIGKLFG